MATSTPWGASQYSKTITRGIVFYGTAGHGGFHVSETFLKQMPDYLKTADTYANGMEGWFEEDSAWVLVVTAFPQLFTEKDQISAKDTLRNWYPDAYEKHYNLVLQPGESHVKDERAFYAAHKDDYLVVSAVGDWHKDVPKGYVGVTATKGGRTPDGHIPTERRYFLVPQEEYAARTKFDFVVDPSKHKEVSSIG
jgi:hypothetical protein